ncbi:TPA: hypothetical protein MNK97_005281 [Klebsiella pneumoniae]|nr:hypothetical protein [Klebsiella pneumoniae]
MAIKIHHGPNGSYKTSGAVWDDAVPAAKAGRVIITNIRGMSTERFENLFPDLPDTFEVINIDHQLSEGMERIRNWFHWAPRNAFLIFDEAQTLFPKHWTQKDLDKFDFPGGQDKAFEADRPMNFLDAWTRHRHWNWDVILTTPNIKYVHEQVRNTSEAAYQHSNLMLLGKWLKMIVGKDYKEAMHNAQENRAPTDGSNIVALRKIDKRVFKLYDSTATGQHRDTMAGKNALASPRVLLLLGVIAGIFGYLYSRDGTAMFSNPLGVKHAETAAVSAPAAPVADPRSAQPVGVNPVPGQQVDQRPGVAQQDPFGGLDVTIKACLETQSKGVICQFQFTKGDRSFMQSTKDLKVAGYEVRALGLCAAELTFHGAKRTVVCSGDLSGQGAETAKRLGAERQGSGALASSPVVTAREIGGPQQQFAGVPVTVVPDTEYPSRPWRN